MPDSPLIKNNNRSSAAKRIDAVAVAVFIVSAVYFIFAVRYGVQPMDEGFYFSMAHRVVQGDRLIVDEWHITQMITVLNYYPFKLYYALFGTTDGVIMAFRYFYVFLKMGYYAFLYVSLRRFGIWGLIASIICTHFHTFSYTTTSYYNLCLMMMISSCVLFFLYKKRRPLVLITSGFLFALTVVQLAPAAIIYFAYTVLVLIISIKNKRRQSSDTPDEIKVRTWLYFTIGVAAAFIIFVICGYFDFFKNASLKEILSKVPEVMNDSEYTYNSLDGYLKIHKLKNIIKFTAYVPPILCVVFAALVLFSSRSVRSDRLKLFASSVVLYIICSVVYHVYPFIYSDVKLWMTSFRPIINAYFGLIWYLMLNNKDKTLFKFWLTGAVFSFIFDLFSQVAYCLGSLVCTIPSILMLGKLLNEIKSESFPERESRYKDLRQYINDIPDNKLKRQKTKIARVALVSVSVMIVSLLINESVYCGYLAGFHLIEDHYVGDGLALDSKLVGGPLDGVISTSKIKGIYQDTLDDLDMIKNDDDGRLYVAGHLPWAYLYCDKGYSTFSTFFVLLDSKTRPAHWWDTYPDKKPDYIYIPFYSCMDYSINKKDADSQLEYISSIFKVKIYEGKQGYVLRVTK